MDLSSHNNGREPGRLSSHDRAILGKIFSPHLQTEVDEVDEISCGGKSDFETLQPYSDDLDLVTRIKELEVEGVLQADKGDLTTADQLFTQVIDLLPERAAGYNNRAQTRRLMGRIPDAEADLEKALSLSNGTGVVACQAFNQRALLRSLKGDEAGALEDFKKAAQLGSEFAKTQLIARNPYAALCNAMMTEMIAKVRRGECS